MKGETATCNVDLSIIIVNWKSLHFTRACVSSIYAAAAAVACEIIVVDNGSHDGCDEMLQAEFPEVIFLQSPDNVGFARANNWAFARSRGQNVLFLNPDTEVLEGSLQTLLAALQSLPGAGMVGARLLNTDRTLQTTCVAALPSLLNQTLNSAFLRKVFPKWRMWGMRPLFDGSNTPQTVEAISGACMMGKREAVKAVGAFSTNYFMYSEDMDLCVKLATAGWKIYYVPDARIVHHASGSSSSRKESNFGSVVLRESVARYMRVHHGRLYEVVYKVSSGLVAASRIVLLSLALPLALDERWRRGLKRAFRKWAGILAWSMGGAGWARQQ